MPAALKVDGLTVRRGGHELLAGVSFEARAGEVLAVIGPNGAGKTTLLRAVLGQVPQVGAVRAEPAFWLPDDAVPPAELSVGQQLALSQALSGATGARGDELARRLGLAPLSSARCGTLSRGEARRLLLHGALLSPRPLLVLDEPLGTFDPLQLRELVALLREKARAGTAVVLSVHQLFDAEKVGDRFLLLHEGRLLAQGDLAALRAQAQLQAGSLEDVFLALLERRRVA